MKYELATNRLRRSSAVDLGMAVGFSVEECVHDPLINDTGGDHLNDTPDGSITPSTKLKM